MHMTDPPEGLTRALVESITWDTTDNISPMFDLHPEEEGMT